MIVRNRKEPKIGVVELETEVDVYRREQIGEKQRFEGGGEEIFLCTLM